VRAATQISAGFGFSLALSEGVPYAWGFNGQGELGDGGTSEHNKPIRIAALSGVEQLAAGEHSSLATTSAPLTQRALSVQAAAGSLEVQWTAPLEPGPWLVSYRRVAQPVVPWERTLLPAAATGYTVGGLRAQPYEVLVRNVNFGTRIAIATPLAVAAVQPSTVALPPPVTPSGATSGGETAAHGAPHSRRRSTGSAPAR
jgi:hypothetical protein